MKSLKQVLTNILIFLILILVTFIIIFTNFDYDKTMDIISNAKSIYIIVAILLMSLYFVFEGISIKNVLNQLGEKVT